LCALVVALLFATTSRAQTASENELKITVGPEDYQAAASSTMVYRHAKPANTPAGRLLRAKESTSTKALQTNTSNDPGGILQYPGDVQYLGGPVVEFAQFHAIYMLPNGYCPIPTCWGDPEGFLGDLGKSNFIHLVDQYIGFFGGDRYTVGFRVKHNYTPPEVPLTDANVQAVVEAAAKASGAVGYTHIYHVFLPPGQDICFDTTFSECYSPDNEATFFFCGYHFSVDFPNVGHVLYSVQPYQNVPGCQVRPGTPNGELIDSTDNTLNHESFEAISDPDGNAWINNAAIVLLGEEISDECSFETVIGSNAYYNPPSFQIYDHSYAVQSIYSNTVHACGTAP